MSHARPPPGKGKINERGETHVWASLEHFTSSAAYGASTASFIYWVEYVARTAIAIRCVYDTNMEHANSK